MGQDSRRKPNKDGQVVLVAPNAINSVLAKLPPDVIINIAFSMPEAKDVFAFLEALRPFINLGPLEHLYQLGRSFHHGDVWPSLWLKDQIFDALSIPPRQSIVTYFPAVTIDDGWDAIEWYKMHLNPSAKVEWCITTIPKTINNFEVWTNMRITDVTITISKDTASTWMNLLERLDHLTALRVNDEYGNLEDVYTFLASSKKIIVFELFGPKGYELRRGDLLHLIEWFRRQPVREFGSWFTNWSNLDAELSQVLCEAMFNCPTLEKLRLSDCSLHHLDFSKFSFCMKSLELDELHSNTMLYLSDRLNGSRLTDLIFRDCADDCAFGALKFLLGKLPLSIKTLNIYRFNMSSAQWIKLIPLLQNCGLQDLAINPKTISPAFARTLGKAVENNQTIRQLHLYKCKITVPDLKLLIQSISHPSRLVTATRIKWTPAITYKFEAASLKDLQEFAPGCGCEFVHESVFD